MIDDGGKKEVENHTCRRRLQKYKSVNNHLRSITDKAREKWWDEQHAKLQKHERQGNMDHLYRMVSQVTNRKKQFT